MIDGMPPGIYTIEIWHERLGRQSQRIVVRDNGTTDVDVASVGIVFNF